MVFNKRYTLNGCGKARKLQLLPEWKCCCIGIIIFYQKNYDPIRGPFILSEALKYWCPGHCEPKAMHCKVLKAFAKVCVCVYVYMCVLLGCRALQWLFLDSDLLKKTTRHSTVACWKDEQIDDWMWKKYSQRVDNTTSGLFSKAI